MFTYFVTVPHSLFTQLAFPVNNAKQGTQSLSISSHAVQLPGRLLMNEQEDMKGSVNRFAILVDGRQCLWSHAKQCCKGHLHHSNGHP